MKPPDRNVVRIRVIAVPRRTGVVVPLGARRPPAWRRLLEGGLGFALTVAVAVSVYMAAQALERVSTIAAIAIAAVVAGLAYGVLRALADDTRGRR